MRPDLSLRSFYALTLVFAFSLSFQTICEAQLTINNNTNCTIYLQASQVLNGGRPCTPCNVSSVTAIPAGGTWVHPGDATCGHFRWLAVRWFVGAIGGVPGVSYNPIWAGHCGASTRGDQCGGTATYAVWDVPSSPGPATVDIY